MKSCALLWSLLAIVLLLGAAPTATLDITVQATGSSSSGTTLYDGCQMFPSYSYYNTDIYSYPIASNSALKIQSAEHALQSKGYADTFEGNGGGVGLERLNVANASTPLLTGANAPQLYNYQTGAQRGSDPVPWPWVTGFWIESAGDHHSEVLDTAGAPNGCHLYELYGGTFANGKLTVSSDGNGDIYDLSKEFPGYSTYGGATEARTSLFAPAIKYSEIESGQPITHVISAIFIQFSGNCTAGGYNGGCFEFGHCETYPASNSLGGVVYGEPSSASTYTTDLANAMCIGQHIRLHANFASSQCAGAQGQVLVHALQHYGMEFDDSDPAASGHETRFIDNDYAAGVGDITNYAGTMNTCLSSIHITDFDVLATQTPGTAP